MNANRLVIGAFSSLLCSSAFSGAMGPSVIASDWTQVMTLSMGPIWSDKGDTQTFFLAPEIEKTYTADNSTSSLFNGEFFYGWQRRINAKFQGQIGLAVAATTNTAISGEIWDDADPEFNNYIYSYKINHTHVALKGKLLADVGYIVSPYISGSIGVGFNRAHDFTNTPIIFEAITNPNFASRTQTAFSYTIGVGVQKALNERWQVGVGYELADWGQSQLGLAMGQTLGNGLSQSHTYTNGVLFSISCVG
ncbi:outer membrane protein [Legionella fallonii]|uniref:Outer membrane protein beta-barrel domain-containing protein n=1 Tax=Legionella fallonii LLAP-10 TaxID=1212491 RepID=A0A098G303_9GAMM|nr:outer membrane beta-barrel protein [Legionella fallonii]CEG56862.1 conserved exported protein of unknown function [Legionella fallonii LLAP-10]